MDSCRSSCLKQYSWFLQATRAICRKIIWLLFIFSGNVGRGKGNVDQMDGLFESPMAKGIGDGSSSSAGISVSMANYIVFVLRDKSRVARERTLFGNSRTTRKSMSFPSRHCWYGWHCSRTSKHHFHNGLFGFTSPKLLDSRERERENDTREMMKQDTHSLRYKQVSPH